MNRPLRVGSVCSGICAPEVAWRGLVSGGEAPAFEFVFRSEIEKFPDAVAQHHFPHVPNLGDMTKFKDWPDYAIDILVGGTPCQSFSVAGLRKGMADPRGNLALVFLGIVDRYRPTWVVWENVPGVHSSWSDEAAYPASEESGEIIGKARRLAEQAGIDLGPDFDAGEFEEVDQSNDFDCFLAALEELGYGIATTILDAQFFGVAQRRERVFVVGHIGGEWQRAAAVLFERGCLCGHPAPRRETGKRVAPTISARTEGGGGLGTDFDCGGLIETSNIQDPISKEAGMRFGVPEAQWEEMAKYNAEEQLKRFGTTRARLMEEEVCGVKSNVPEIAYALQERDSKGSDSTTKDGHLIPLSRPIAFSSKDHGADAGEVCPTLRACPHDDSHANGGAPPAIAFNLRGREGGAQAEVDEDGLANLRAASGGSSRTYAAQSYSVRRLTPRECERLQGFPDDYTQIAWGKKPPEQCPDGPRYKALGNSMAVPVMRWIGEQILRVNGEWKMENGE